MKLIEQKENQIIFTAEIEESLANSIRRYLNRIPLVAVDEVEISKNDSALYDETIAHRIGLIPIKMEKSTSEKKTYKMHLDVKKEGNVYSKDLVGDLKVVYGNIPLTNLAKNQELKLSATLISGKGKDHAKFSPGLMFYRNLMDIKIDKDCPKEIIDICPKGVFELKDGKVVVKEAAKCDDCDACIEFCRKKGKDPIKLTSTNELVITIESFGQLDVKEILPRAIEELKKDLLNVSKDLK